MRRQLLCPSAPCDDGAILIGVVLSDGQIAFAAEEAHVDREFVQLARAGRAPEKRFRFASRCMQGGCRQWTGSRCGVIDRVLDEVAPPNASPNVPAALPACAIRDRCRWFDQAGAEACAVCTVVITDSR